MPEDMPKDEAASKTTTLESLARSRKGSLDLSVVSTEPDVLITLRNWENDETITYSVAANVLTEIGRKPGKKRKSEGGKCCPDLESIYD